MDYLVEQLVRYFADTLGTTITPRHWKEGDRLPPFLQDRYAFIIIRFFDTPCLMMIARNEQGEPPTVIRKHVEQMHKQWDGPVIYVQKRIAAYNRKRLIEQRVPFVVPGNQMYLPTLGIDLREYYRTQNSKPSQLKPASQAVLIYTLIHGVHDFSSAELSQALGYSPMTISRAMDELVAADLVSSPPEGRERYLRLTEPRPLIWKKAQAYLRSPVKRREWIYSEAMRKLSGPRAGLTALAGYSDIAKPANMVVALNSADWRELQKTEWLMKAIPGEPDAINVEIWSYAPSLFATGGLVDCLSLYLSLRNTKDERVQIALEEMMRNIEW